LIGTFPGLQHLTVHAHRTDTSDPKVYEAELLCLSPLRVLELVAFDSDADESPLSSLLTFTRRAKAVPWLTLRHCVLRYAFQAPAFAHREQLELMDCRVHLFGGVAVAAAAAAARAGTTATAQTTIAPSPLVTLRRLYIARCWDRAGDASGTSEMLPGEKKKREEEDREERVTSSRMFASLPESDASLLTRERERRITDEREREQRNRTRNARPRALTLSWFVQQLPALECLSYSDVGLCTTVHAEFHDVSEETRTRVPQEWLRDDILHILQHAPHLTHLCLRGLSVLSPETRRIIRHAVQQRTISNPTTAALEFEE
jgi:hypothetical protein